MSDLVTYDEVAVNKVDSQSVDALLQEQLDSVDSHSHTTAVVEQQDEAGMPQLDVDTFPSQIFWLVITFGILYVLISKRALPRIHEVIDKRRHRIERDLDKAELLSEEASKAQSDYEALQAKARDKSASIIAAANQDIQQHSEAQHASTDKKIAEMLGEADAAITAKQQSFKTELVTLSESLASSLVEELTGKAPTKASLQSALKQHG